MKPAAPQQANLTEFWGKKNASNASKSKAVDMEVDPPEAESSSPGRQRTPSPISAEELRAISKKRKVVVSDEEDPESSSSQSNPTRKRVRSASPQEDRSTRGNKKEDSAMSEPDHDSGESEVELDDEDAPTQSKSSAAANAKLAQAARERLQVVDIKGGWKTGASIPYAALANTFSLIEATTKRLEKNAILTAFLLLVIQRSTEGNYHPLLQAVYLCINRLSPDYEGIELGIGESLLIKAIGESTGRKADKIKEELKKEGDLGLVAMNSRSMQRTMFVPKPLMLDTVFKDLKTIALTTGQASQDKKVKIITRLLASCRGIEAKYIIRSLEGKLRIGNAERSVLVSLAQAAVLNESDKGAKKLSPDKLAGRIEEGVQIMKKTFSELPSYDRIVPMLLKHGIHGLEEHCSLTPGIPLKPMLAKPTKAIGEVLDRFENKSFTCEYKYDGERAQVHRTEDGAVSVFSRNSEDMSKKYPDLVEVLPKAFPSSTKSFVLDAEAVAVDRTNQKLMPFQELSKRKRKDVKLEDIQIQVCLFAFDLLYLNGESLLHKTLQERRRLLQDNFHVVHGEFDFAKSSDSETTDEIQSFLQQSVKDGCEGLMVKMLDTDASYYEPSRRSVNWLKLKKDYLQGVGDSLDLVVVGAYYGKGKRTHVYGAFLLACFDPDSEEYQTICKIGTGFSEEMLQLHHDLLRPLETTAPRGDVKVGGAKPDIWIEPKVVWEVLTADLSLSPIYTAARGLVDDRGISLRFPRFVRVRDDKSAEDATGPEQIAEMFERQALAQKSSKATKEDDFW